MLLRFSLPYRTAWGQRIVVCGSEPALGQWDLAQALPLHYTEATGVWHHEIDLPDALGTLTYKYVLLDANDGGRHWEWGPNRTLTYDGQQFATVEAADSWRPAAEPENELYTAAFTRALLRRPAGKGGKKAPARKKKTTGPAPATVRFQLEAPRVDPAHQVCVVGSDPALGGWDAAQPVLLSDKDYPRWSADVVLSQPDEYTHYKYALWDAEARQIVQWEEGENRFVVPLVPAGTLRVQADERFRYRGAPWRGAGVALPVFSLRSRQGLGVGEFADLKLLVDWAGRTGLKMVQILPINDTTATHTWVDSYPYAAISVFALHPQYLNLEAVARLKRPADRQELARLRDELNARDFVDYEPMMQAKWHFLRKLYQQEKEKFLADPAFQEFLAEQQAWLVPYAAFCGLRDRFGTADFQQWPAEYRTPAQAGQLTQPDQPDFDAFGLHFFTQFHLDKQLKAAVEYARARGVVLKGDLPIGIYRHSVDAWTQPELYHMDRQAGAPPDDFSLTGQNWRFPTYNWERMAEDGYAWWRGRLGHLARYFDALRIDHILGFFRIWEIPAHSVEGLLGHFAPALPLHQHEIEQRLGWFDYQRLCEPYIRWELLTSIFHEQAATVAETFLDDAGHGTFRLKDHVRTQRRIEALFEQEIAAQPDRAEHLRWLRTGLYQLTNEVLLVPADEPGFYHPRITLPLSNSFRVLEEENRQRLRAIYNDFFYQRHEAFWRDQGMVKLPPVRFATDMLICGEDLGMVPASVPGVMKALGMLGLNIQRMSADPAVEFGAPGHAPYLSVVSPGSHDMSTLRGWWEEDRALTQRFFEEMLGHWGQSAPFYCEPWVVREIIEQHLYSPAMWAIFPLQDLLALDAHLRRPNPADEQINVPANPQHYWKYRLHLDLEELLTADEFNAQLQQLVADSQRVKTYA